jgi:hypothetical protein
MKEKKSMVEKKKEKEERKRVDFFWNLKKG